jgi:hydrogenase maturation protease
VGSIIRLDAIAAPMPTGFFSYSTHAFGLAEAVETSRNLGTLPEKLIIYAIEGHAFGQGDRVSAAVEKAVKSVVERVLAEVGVVE